MENKITLVTGAAGHIGSEICHRIAGKGGSVFLADKNKDAAESLKLELSEKYEGTFHTLDLDLMNSDAPDLAYSKVNELEGRLDCLVNCAAFYDDTPGWGVPFEEESQEAWMKVLQVNTIAPFFLAQKLYPLLSKSQDASIVNVSSIYGLVGPDHSLYEGTDMTNPAVYGVSKGGLQQITKWLSTVLAPKVRVNTVTPGGLYRGQLKSFVDKYESRTPLKRMANEKDVANAIVFLLSKESNYITGHNLVVDGGWTAW